MSHPRGRTAAAALTRFAALLPDKGYELFITSGGAPDRHRNIVAFEDGAALCAPPGCHSADASLFRQTLARHIAGFSAKLPSLGELFSPAVGVHEFEAGLANLSRQWFRHGRDAPDCLLACQRIHERVCEGDVWRRTIVDEHHSTGTSIAFSHVAIGRTQTPFLSGGAGI